MKKTLLLTLLALGLLVAWVALPTVFADSNGIDMMKAQIAETFQFGGKVLPAGEYEIVHDDAMKERGMPCLSIWKTTRRGSRVEQKKLASSYCVRVAREVKPKGYLGLEVKSAGRYQITEIQFPGDNAAHVPQTQPAATR